MMRTSTLIGCVLPEAFDDALLQDAEQLDLDFHRQLADLVEEDRGQVGGLEAADLPRERARVGAPLAAEQLALDERRRDGARSSRGSSAVCARGLSSWIACANTSLPVPVSPSSRTVAGVGATCSTCARAWRIARLPDTIRREPLEPAHARLPALRTGGRGLAQLVQLVERALQRLVAGLPRQRLADHARDDPQLLDDRGRPVVFARRGTEQPGRRAHPPPAAERHREHRRRLDALPQEGAAIDGVVQLVEPREQGGLACQQRRGGKRSQLRAAAAPGAAGADSCSSTCDASPASPPSSATASPDRAAAPRRSGPGRPGWRRRRDPARRS